MKKNNSKSNKQITPKVFQGNTLGNVPPPVKHPISKGNNDECPYGPEYAFFWYRFGRVL